jgi:hypothetical protein
MLSKSLFIKATVAFLGTVVVVAGVAAGLAYTGTPEPCAGGQVPVSAEARLEFHNKWGEFKVRSASAPTSETFTESQVTSRGVEFLETKGYDIEDLQLFFCQEGYAEQRQQLLSGVQI